MTACRCSARMSKSAAIGSAAPASPGGVGRRRRRHRLAATRPACSRRRRVADLVDHVVDFAAEGVEGRDRGAPAAAAGTGRRSRSSSRSWPLCPARTAAASCGAPGQRRRALAHAQRAPQHHRASRARRGRARSVAKSSAAILRSRMRRPPARRGAAPSRRARARGAPAGAPSSISARPVALAAHGASVPSASRRASSRRRSGRDAHSRTRGCRAGRARSSTLRSCQKLMSCSAVQMASERRSERSSPRRRGAAAAGPPGWPSGGSSRAARRVGVALGFDDVLREGVEQVVQWLRGRACWRIGARAARTPRPAATWAPPASTAARSAR